MESEKAGEKDKEGKAREGRGATWQHARDVRYMKVLHNGIKSSIGARNVSNKLTERSYTRDFCSLLSDCPKVSPVFLLMNCSSNFTTIPNVGGALSQQFLSAKC